MSPPKFRHSKVVRNVAKVVEAFVSEARLGGVYVEAAFILGHTPPTVRVPDVAVLSDRRAAAADPDSYVKGAPEIAIEVVSPSNTAEDMDEKVSQYLASGAKSVWVLYPKTATVFLYRAGRSPEAFSSGDTLSDSEALPGWSCAVDRLFD